MSPAMVSLHISPLSYIPKTKHYYAKQYEQWSQVTEEKTKDLWCMQKIQCFVFRDLRFASDPSAVNRKLENNDLKLYANK